MRRKLLFSFIFVLLGLVFSLSFSLKAEAIWEDTNNNPVLTTEWDNFKLSATSRIDTYETYFIVTYNIPLTDINNKVLVFNKYSVLDSWNKFGGSQSDIVIEYSNKPSVVRRTGYYINNTSMTEIEREDAFNRFFNSQFLFLNEDLQNVSKITLTLWLDSNGFSKSPPNYENLDYYDDIVYLMPIDELPLLNSFNLKSRKYYFKDYAIYNGSNFYYFDFSTIPNVYDYFIFNFSDNIPRSLIYGNDYIEISVNTNFGIMLTDRDDLNWDLFFYNDFNDDDYFIAYDYNYITNLNDSLSRDIIDAYNTGFRNGKDKGLDEGLEIAKDMYADGYDEAKRDYAYYDSDSDTYISARAYGLIRFQEGLGEGDSLELQIYNFLPGVLGSIFLFFFQIASIKFMGISLLSIISLVIGVAAIVFLIRFFLK